MEICTIGGYEEVGKNMTAVKLGEDVVIFDAGIHLPAVIEMQNSESIKNFNEKKMREFEALPDDFVLDKLGWRNKVRAIVIGHAHLDHVGGVPYLAHRYPQAEILATPFTMAVLNKIIEDEKVPVKNRKRIIQPNSMINIKGKSGTYKLDFVHTTHSTIQCVFLALHSKDGIFFYALDFKFDNYPIMGDPPNYKKLKELGKKGVKVLVVDALYSGTDRRTASERIARNLVEDAIGTVHDKNSALFITTFSSHIARLKSIVDFGKKTGRQIVFLGRSLNKYVNCAKSVKLCPFVKNVQLVTYKNQVQSMLKRIEKDRGKYLVVCTGHQAEPGSILDRITRGETGFKFRSGDNLIFSSSIIPAPVNIASRDKMDKKLRKLGVRLQTDVHVSGHGGREDLRDLVELLKPGHIIPAHGSLQQETPMIELAGELGYKFHERAHLSSNGKVLKF
jgi:ribonuclease J